MSRVMPSQVVETIDEMFPHAGMGRPYGVFTYVESSKFLGILNLVKEIPSELINLCSADYAELILATSAIEAQLEIWKSNHEVVSKMKQANGGDPITVIRRVLAKCPDEYPPQSTTELSFITDNELRESIRRDAGGAIRALNNAEWKAATVLAGATIEALLHWRLREPLPGSDALQDAVNALVRDETFAKKPKSEMGRWCLHHFIEVATHLKLIKPDTSSAAKLAQNFRNLIHPGRVARLEQTCDRGTAYSAIGAMEHVIRDLGSTSKTA